MKNINTTLWAYDAMMDSMECAEHKEAFVEVYNREPENEEELWQFCDSLNDEYYNDLISEIDYDERKNGQKTYVVLATIGTWMGPRDGGQIITGLAEVFSKCSADYNTYYYKNSQLRITAHHHDGTNIFKVRELTDDGLDYIENHPFLSDRELHERLFNNSRYSRMVQLFPKLYGLL